MKPSNSNPKHQVYLPIDIGNYTKVGFLSERRGFALIATISIMALLLIVAMAMLPLSRVEVRSSQHNKHLVEAEANARMALMLALGELQASAGPDQRITAAADLLSGDLSVAEGRAHWIGVWNTEEYNPKDPENKEFVRWLVSAPGAEMVELAEATTGADDVTLFTGEDGAATVKVPKVKIDNVSKPGAYAYWVEDLGLKADLQWSEGDFRDDDQSQVARLTVIPGPDYGVFEGPFSGKTSYPIKLDGGMSWLVDLDKAVSAGEMPLVTADGGHQRDWLRRKRHDITFGSYGVLADVKDGGLRRDLSLAFEMDGDGDVSASQQPTKFNEQVGEFVGGNDRLASPVQVAGMPVAERYLWREMQDSGTPFSADINRADAVMRGPTWWALRDYANLYKRL